MDKKPVSLTEGPAVKAILLFALPILISNLFQQLYNSVDGMVTGTFAGSTALAAVGSTGALINVMAGFFLGIGAGTGVLIAMHYGAKNYTELKRTMDAAIFLSFCAGLFIAVVGVTFAPQFLRLMNTPDDVIDQAVTYLRIYLAGSMINLVYNTGAGIIRATGDSKRPLLYLVAGGVANLIMDLLFVAVFHWGVAGAALATVLAQLVTAVPVVVHLMHFPAEYRFSPAAMSVSRSVMWQLTCVSVPCGLQSSMFGISNLLIQSMINKFGSVVMAGVAAYMRIDGFAYMPMGALSMTTSTWVGQNVGAGQRDRARKGVRICLITCLIACMTTGSGIIAGCNSVIRLFTSDPDTIAVAVQMMWFLAPFAWIFSFSDVFGGAIRGAGHPTSVTVINALFICLFRIIWLFCVLPFFYDIRTVYVCYPITWILCTIVMIGYYIHFARKNLHDTPV